jgi:hypothetical protein
VQGESEIERGREEQNNAGEQHKTFLATRTSFGIFEMRIIFTKIVIRVLTLIFNLFI